MDSSPALPLIPWSKCDILSTRNSHRVTDSVLATAIDLMVLGFPSQANRLVDAVYHSRKLLDCITPVYGYLPTLQAAWAATDSEPEYMRNIDDPNDPIGGYLLGEREKPARRTPDDTVQIFWPSYLKKQYPNFGKKDLEEELQDLDEFGENPNSKSYTPLAVVIDIAILAGDEATARELVEDNAVDLYGRFRDYWDEEDKSAYDMRGWMNKALCVKCSTRAWDILKEGVVGKVLKVDENAIDAFVDEGCKLIEERFTKGMSRPYADKTVSELVEILEENHMAMQKVDGGGCTPIPGSKPGATEEQIESLIKKLAAAKKEDNNNIYTEITHLPEDYTTFLKSTNGFHPDINKPPYINFLHDVDGILQDERPELVREMSQWTLNLFPHEYSAHPNDGFDNIPLTDKASIFTIGEGGDEGNVWLVEPQSVKKALEKFEEAYKHASERNRRIYESAALDLYGGLERLRACEWLVITWFHWDPLGQVAYW